MRRLINGPHPEQSICPETVAATSRTGVYAMNDLENLTANFGLLRREFKDAHAILSRLDASMAAGRRSDHRTA